MSDTAKTPFDTLSVQWKRHRSAKAINDCFIRGMGVNPRDISEMGGETEDGREVTTPMSDVVEGIKLQGMWAFIDLKTKPVTVHYWHDGKRSDCELAHMLGHEVGHALETLPRVQKKGRLVQKSGSHVQRGGLSVHLNGERLADRAGLIAELVTVELARIRGTKPRA